MKKYLPLLGAVVLSVAVMSGGLLIGYNMNAQPAAETVEAVEAVAADVNAEDVTEYTVGAEGSIAVPGYDTITLKAGQRTQVVTLENPPENECYFVISILLPDGEELYKSGYVAPGSKVDTIRLTSAPVAGTYDKAILRYSCWMEGDDGAMVEISGADTICTLEVIP